MIKGVRSGAWAFAVLAFGAGMAQAQHEHHQTAVHKMARGVKLDVKDDAVAQVLTVRLGPLNLPANTDHRATAQPPDRTFTVPVDGWFTAYHSRLVDHTGATVPGKLLHHVGFWNPGRPDFLCPNKQEHIFGAGGEMNQWPALEGFGYRVGRGDRILVNTMFHNPTATRYPEVYLEVRVGYQKKDANGPALKNVYPAWLDVMECGNSGYDLAPGRNVTSGSFTLPHTGVLLGVGGHLHDYGLRLVLENGTRNERVAVLDSELDPAGVILSMPIVSFADRGGYRLSQGNVLKVTATYDNRTGKLLHDGAMGIVVGYFLPDDAAKVAALKRAKK